VTLVMDRGLARLALDDAHSHLMTVDIKCTHCIYVGSASAPLVWQIGRRGVESFRRQLFFGGDRNYYEGYETFWRIDALNDDFTLAMNYDDWRTHWATAETTPSRGKITWRTRPVASLPANFRPAA